MAELVIVYWRDIPTRVIARLERRGRVTVDLPDRFAKAIDRAAMQGDSNEDAESGGGCRKAAPIQISGELQAEAESMARLLDEQYDDARLEALIARGGRAAW